MAARVLDGVAVGNQIRAEVAPAVAAFTQKAGRPPGLGIVLVGENPASEVYVRNKLKSASDAGLFAELTRLPTDASLADLLAVVDTLNRSEKHDGILVQSPLPESMGADAERRVFDVVRADKDVDGFHPTNVGYLVQNRATLVACTPSGVIEILERAGIPISGARAVVIGRSDIVGKPMALLLLHRSATVTVAHSRTVDLPKLAAEADILVAAIGRPGFVTKAFVKPGATVIDVGINRLDTKAAVEKMFPGDAQRMAAFEKRGAMLVGDVHPDVAEIAGAMTPVPGGVGPLTIALLLRNTLWAAEARLRSKSL